MINNILFLETIFRPNELISQDMIEKIAGLLFVVLVSFLYLKYEEYTNTN